MVEPPKPLSIKEKVEAEFGAGHIMVRIARAESEFKNVPNYLYDGEDGYRTAYGPFQITRSTYAGYGCGHPSERLEVDKNIACARIIYDKAGTADWRWSKAMW